MPKSSSSPMGASMDACVSSSPGPSLREALGESTLQNKPFSRPLTKRQSQKFGQATPSKGSFTPRSGRFHPSSRPSTPSSAHSRSPGGSASPLPELDPFEKARVKKEWVEVQLRALSRYPPPDVTLLSPSSTSSKLLTLHQDLKTWTSWLDACELKMEHLQVVELPRMVISARGPPTNIDVYDVILSILPLLKTLRTQLLARRSWIELLGLSLEWEKIRNEVESAVERGVRNDGVSGVSSHLSTLAALAHKSVLLVKSSHELRATLSVEQVNSLVYGTPKERDEVWWGLRERLRDASLGSSGAFSQTPQRQHQHQHQATYTDLLFPPSTSVASSPFNLFPPSISIPYLSPSVTSSSLNEQSSASSASLRSLSLSNSSTSFVQLDHTRNTLPRVIGWTGTEEQKRSWWEVSKLASSNGRARLDFPSFAENGKEGEDVVELGVEIED
ncbi:hypothetical protein BDY24DRAFT_394149 [Mrakia frigida]|uniref:uncharacterized protein n=1 Tax=Mrakia frigida TaxID=29902 RepID=UPI003FCC0C38